MIIYNNTRKQTVAFIRHDLLLHLLLTKESRTCILHCSHLSMMPQSLPVKYYRVESQNTYFPVETTSVKKLQETSTLFSDFI